jgi:hypothetical protein
LVDLTLRLTALGFREFLRDGFNIFDAVVVVISFAELTNLFPSISFLRIFRLLRIFKLIRNWTSLKIIL